MPNEKKQELTTEELAAQQGNFLPDREEMSIINPGAALPMDPSMQPPIATDPTPHVDPGPTPPAVS